MGRVVVVGAGVVGLTTALRLQADGWAVDIVTEHPAAETTSSVAGAIWYPYRADPRDLVLEWGRRGFEALADLADRPGSGIVMREVLELSREALPDPWWREAVTGLRHAAPSELPPGYADALAFTVPTADMPRYLDWLHRRFLAAGGHVARRHLADLDEVGHAGDAVVNCAGLGARDLVDDDRLVPVRGQVVRVANPGLERVLLDEHNPGGVTYVIPRGEDVVLGGTAEEGIWDVSVHAATAESILARCRALEPRLADAPVVGHAVGLRPGRDVVRLEREELAGRIVVHNYGHGGAGVTLSWGCAVDVAALLADLA
ncbi:MAG: FAD-dependent oxidoreductase [Nitriliruptorales bacterium]